MQTASNYVLFQLRFFVHVLNATRTFLCSGTGSVGEPFREAGWEVTDVDWDGRYAAEIQVDITTWDYKNAFEPGHFDVVWGSPDCRMYSITRTRAMTPRYIEGNDKLVQACCDIIEYLQPRGCWFIENPDTGLLKHRGVVAGLPYVRVDYCMCGAPYRKRTRIWTNGEWTPKLCDRSHLVNGRHKMTAQRGPSRNCCSGHGDRCTLDQLHRLPAELCREIYNVALQQQAGSGQGNPL